MTISIKLMGGLGNQLFQIFTLIACSLEYKYPFELPSNKKDLLSCIDKESKRPLYWDNFLSSLKPFTKELNYHPDRFERDFHYTKLKNLKENNKLLGYFQSHLYFEDYYDQIIRFIRLNESKKLVRDKYNYYFNNTTISIHFRIGDYIKVQETHLILPLDYYKKAIRNILNKLDNNEKITIMCFGEEINDSIIEANISILNNEFKNIEFKKIDYEIVDWEQMLIMSMCDHNIIANSSFSWWAAYFNDNKDKIICAPCKWFGAKKKNKLHSLFPNSWNIIAF